MGGPGVDGASTVVFGLQLSSSGFFHNYLNSPDFQANFEIPVDPVARYIGIPGFNSSQGVPVSPFLFFSCLAFTTWFV